MQAPPRAARAGGTPPALQRRVPHLELDTGSDNYLALGSRDGSPRPASLPQSPRQNNLPANEPRAGVECPRPLGARMQSFMKNSFESLFSPRPEKQQTPLTEFFYANMNFRQTVKELEAASEEEHQLAVIEKLHEHQAAVLDCIEKVFADVNDPRLGREYRLKFPSEVQNELNSTFWETLLFAAELIADGRVLEGRERATEALRPAAMALCNAFEAINQTLREQAKRDPTRYSPKVRYALRHFDTCWTTFENLYVRAIVPCKSSKEYDDKQHLTVIMSESVQQGIEQGILTRDMIDECDPKAFLSVPRLAILSATLLDPKSMEGFSIMKPYVQKLRHIRQQLSLLNEEDLAQLREILADHESAPSPEAVRRSLDKYDNRRLSNAMAEAEINSTGEHKEATESPEIRAARIAVVHELFKDIAAISSQLSSGKNSTEFRDILATVFRINQTDPYGDPDEEDDEETVDAVVSVTGVNADSATVGEDDSDTLHDLSDQAIERNRRRSLSRQGSVDPDHPATSDGTSGQASGTDSEAEEAPIEQFQRLSMTLMEHQKATREALEKSMNEEDNTIASRSSFVDEADLPVVVTGKGKSKSGTADTQKNWKKNSDAPDCAYCEVEFTILRRRHHCRCCGDVFCHDCTRHVYPIPELGHHEPVRVCDSCHRQLVEKERQRIQREIVVMDRYQRKDKKEKKDKKEEKRRSRASKKGSTSSSSSSGSNPTGSTRNTNGLPTTPREARMPRS
eukprot:Clim_evm1s75 gene=Clim_evmTU1s75